jgi:hypothetical protein
VDGTSDVAARAPRWAAEAGLPSPKAGETLRAYTSRLGVNYDTLTEGLTAQTLDCANERLATLIRQRCPRAFDHHVETLLRQARG